MSAIITVVIYMIFVANKRKCHVILFAAEIGKPFQ
jgi:hypothetical protein